MPTSTGERHIINEIEDAHARTAFVIIDLEGVASRMTAFAMSRSDLVIIPAQEQQQDAAAAARVIEDLELDNRANNRDVPYALVMTRTRVVAKPRTARFIGRQLADAGIPIFTTEINERDAFAGLFTTGGNLRGLDPDEVNNIDAAIENAGAFASEVIDRLDRRQAGKREASHGQKGT